jgi:hypothetical protein
MKEIDRKAAGLRIESALRGSRIWHLWNHPVIVNPCRTLLERAPDMRERIVEGGFEKAFQGRTRSV